jgi:hypothetical protein
MLRKLSLALAASLLLAGAAQAATLIDTGTPTGVGYPGIVDSNDFLAVQFTATDAWRIDGVAAYLTGSGGDHFALALYQDAVTHVPGDLVASTTVSFAADGWNGASALGWQLTSGSSYWLGVESVDGSFIAPVGGLTMPGATAFSDGSHQGAYQPYAGIQFGLQVTGAVPEPASIALLLAGLALVGAAARPRASRKG